ncbi:MAG: 2-dehydro-3-deoxy-6-phosphogalactonate aldolase [Victivallales bacterium]|nr:2-dehydro-3-deoxy-6-phosphogalactonate aldolase [Victivallales bacterium]
MKQQFEAFMKECPAIAILRGITPDETEAVCDLLYKEGIRILEIPLNSPDVFTSIRRAAKHCGDRMIVGAGTVLTEEDVQNVRQAGGTFIVSPNTDADVIRATKAAGMVSIPGFFTASEGFVAVKAGADYLKLFPAILGPGYVKDLKAVIKTPILAVGGVNAENIPAFMKVCAGVGIGSAVYKPGKTLDEIAAAAHGIVKAVSGNN